MSVARCGALLLTKSAVRYSRRVSDAEARSDAGLPVRSVTLNQLVGFNMRWFRGAAGLTQEELGRRLGGWSRVVVSAAERSWDGQRIRQFDADEIVAIARALGIPVVALLLPPPDSGTGIDYTLIAGPDQIGADDLVQLVITDYLGDAQGMVAFRERLMQIGGSRFMEAATQEAERVLMAARDQALQMIDEGGEAARELERDAQERHRQAVGSLVQQREELERRIDGLRAFEREYRSRLGEFLEGMLGYLRAGADDGPSHPATGSNIPMGGPRP